MVYVPLHLHTHFSQMDGVATPEEYVSRALDIGMNAISITDHGTLSGHRPMYRAAKAAGIKPILGVEGYITHDRFDKRDKSERTTPLDLVYSHIVVLAKNNVGLENLGKLNEIAWNEGYYRKPRIDFEVLDKYGDGLIITSACMSGLINKAIEVEDYAVAKQHLKWFGDRFGDDFYVEVMPHNPPEINKALIELADSGGYKIVVTPDCHHATADQKIIQEMMLILNTHAKLEKDITYDKSKKFDNMMERLDYLYGKDRMMSFNKFDIHLLSADEMRQAMEQSGGFRDDMFANTLEVANKVEDYIISRNLNLLPVEYRDPDKEIRDQSMAFLKDNDLDEPEYIERLEEELAIIKEKKFASYFIVVRNMLNWAKKNNIMVGPGRGSSAGSLVCYALGITDIDPIKHGLLFFRFIDIDRDDFPDVDSDIQDSRREEGKDFKNTPKLPKSKILFNLHRVRRHDTVYVVESSFDAIRLDQCGVPAVATLGANVPNSQAELLTKHFNNVIVIPDNDDAGQAMAQRIIDKVGPRASAIGLPKRFKDIGDMSDSDIGELTKRISDPILAMY